MTLVTVIGTQWGDEGKGKIVDLLADKADCVVRFQGGHNAGHTLVIGGTSYKLSLLPSGIVRKNAQSFIGNGVVVDPFALLREIETVTKQGLTVTPDNLFLADNCHLILPIHQRLDMAMEEARGGQKIGTTGRGIGPAYEDKVSRRGVRVCDLRDTASLTIKIQAMMLHHNALLSGLGLKPVDAPAMINDLIAIAAQILAFACDVSARLDDAYKDGKHILFEGAQGSLLDIDHGTYPFVTSSNTIAGQTSTGCGLGAARHAHIIGLAKAYTTRVGNGPFPTELHDEIGQFLGEKGHEFGTVTGRKRRCGWFDATLVAQSCIMSGVDSIALTKLDVLDGLKELKICTGYKIGNTTFDRFPTDALLWDQLQPIYETYDGWDETTVGITDYNALPPACKTYIGAIEKAVGVPISIISTSPERDHTIVRKNFFS